MLAIAGFSNQPLNESKISIFFIENEHQNKNFFSLPLLLKKYRQDAFFRRAPGHNNAGVRLLNKTSKEEQKSNDNERAQKEEKCKKKRERGKYYSGGFSNNFLKKQKKCKSKGLCTENHVQSFLFTKKKKNQCTQSYKSNNCFSLYIYCHTRSYIIFPNYFSYLNQTTLLEL